MPAESSPGYRTPDISAEQRALWESVEATRVQDEWILANRPPDPASIWQRIRGWFA